MYRRLNTSFQNMTSTLSKAITKRSRNVHAHRLEVPRPTTRVVTLVEGMALRRGLDQAAIGLGYVDLVHLKSLSEFEYKAPNKFHVAIVDFDYACDRDEEMFFDALKQAVRHNIPVVLVTREGHMPTVDIPGIVGAVVAKSDGPAAILRTALRGFVPSTEDAYEAEAQRTFRLKTELLWPFVGDDGSWY